MALYCTHILSHSQCSSVSLLFLVCLFYCEATDGSSSTHELTWFPYFDALLCRLPLTLRCQREIHHAACRKKTWHCRLGRPLCRDEIQSCSHPPLPSLSLSPSTPFFLSLCAKLLSRNFPLFPRHHSFPSLSLEALKDPGLRQEPLPILLSSPNT